MAWIIAFHLIFAFTWFAGLFYLPRLFVYHAMSDDHISNERFKIMERKLFYGITTPGAVLTTLFGIWILSLNWQYYQQAGWLHAKLSLILILWVYHIYCGRLVSVFKHDKNTKSHVFYRWFNEFPVLLLIGIIVLAIVRPF